MELKRDLIISIRKRHLKCLEQFNEGKRLEKLNTHRTELNQEGENKTTHNLPTELE